MTLEYPQEIYPKEVLIKAAFKFLDQAYIHIDKDYGKYIVSISIGIWDYCFPMLYQLKKGRIKKCHQKVLYLQ